VAGAALVVAPFAAAPARADSINAGGLVTSNITIDRIDGNTVYYKTQSGTSNSKTISDKLKISITDEPSLSTAEDAYGAGQWAEATDGYLQTLKSTNKPWLKDYAALRLMAAADKANRFDAAITAWLAMLARNPAQAAAHKPKFPADPSSTYWKTGLQQLDSAAASERDAGRLTAIRALELEVARGMKDDAKVAEIANLLTKSGNDGSAGGSTSANVQAVVEAQLGLARVAVDKRDFAGAQQRLEQIKPSVTDPNQEADWLWLRAEAQAGQLPTSGGDPAAIDDAALSYMRLVANCPNSPKVPQALLKTAALLERSNDKPTALSVYQEVARDYANQPAGKEAERNVDRLKGTAGGAP
jgi:tetratricopeptide (TPR) repeat protein